MNLYQVTMYGHFTTKIIDHVLFPKSIPISFLLFMILLLEVLPFINYQRKPIKLIETNTFSRLACVYCVLEMLTFLLLLAVVQWRAGQGSVISAVMSTVEHLPEEVSVGRNYNFTIVAKDQNGEKMLHGGSIWSVRWLGPVHVSPSCITDHGNGEYGVAFTLPQPGNYDLQIELKYQQVNTSNSSICAHNRTKVVNMYTACNPKSTYFVSVDGLKGCAHNLASTDCMSSMQTYISCMDHIRDVCHYPHLIRERFTQARHTQARGVGMVSPSTSRVCLSRAEVLGPGHWVNVTHTCAVARGWEELGYPSEQACRDAIYPCSTSWSRPKGGDPLSGAICSAELIWRPTACFLSPMPRHSLRHRHIFFYGVSTIEEIARRMREYYNPENFKCLRDLRSVADIPWRQPNTTFFLHACGEQAATTLSLTLFDKHRHRSCQVFTRNLHRLMSEPSVPSQQQPHLSSSSSSIDIVYQRHPVNYPRNAHTPAEINNAIGRYPGSRGYMSADALLTDFYDDIMTTYTEEQVPLAGILNQQAMTETLWAEYGDALHYNNDALRFVLDACVLLLANVAVLPAVPAPPASHDPLLGTCPSSFRAQGLYHTLSQAQTLTQTRHFGSTAGYGNRRSRRSRHLIS